MSGRTFLDEPPVVLTPLGEAVLVVVVCAFLVGCALVGLVGGTARQCASLTAQHSPRAAAVCPPEGQR
jgi:hypothetical protein